MQESKKTFRSLLAILLALALLCGQCIGVTAAGISKADSSAVTAPGAISWRLAPTRYETEDTVVMGALITDFISASSVLSGADCTAATQTAIDLLYNAGGGTLFFPEGQYTFNGTLVVKKGVTLCGDWQNPVDHPVIAGTVFKVYSGRGNENGTAFITMQPNACVRNMSFWYPEQNASNIVAYPPTICMSDPTVWGADYMHVKNVTLVNSYIGIISATVAGGQMPVCPTLRYIYGSPLKLGVDMDGIVDIGRFDYMFFSPDYWINSGLAGAPAASNTTYKNFIYNNGVGVALGRIDWSYLTYTNVNGYNQGLRFRESTIDPGNAPNGECYAMTLQNCKYGIYTASMSTCGEAMTKVKIEGCEYGLYIERDTKNAEGVLQMLDVNIQATNYAVYHDGYIHLMMQNATLNGAMVQLNNGVSTFTGCAFNKSGTQITCGNDCMNAIFSGCTYNGGMGISGNTAGKVAVDNESAEVASISDIPDFEYDYTCKPAREYLYVVNANNTGSSDVTATIQAALNEAGNDGGGVVFLAPGHYRLNGTLTVPSGVELKGAVDIGRNPIQLGTIFEVYGKTGGADGTATVTLSANSGIRGIVFNQPQQNYENIQEYPYCVRGNGSDIYVINVSLRGVYNGVDLMTNRCDNHYVEYLSGITMKNIIKVGGGSVGGVVCNTQVNLIGLTNGNEEKFGSWPNSPSGLNTDEAFLNRMRQAVNTYLYENAEIMTFGDATDEMLYGNFSYSGRYGVRFIAENGQAASGWLIGQGVDSGIRSIHVDAVESMPMINTQIVAINRSEYTSETAHHVVTGSGFNGTVTMYNTAMWGAAGGFVNLEGGTVRLVNSNYFNFVNYFGHVSTGAHVDVLNAVFHCNGGQTLFSDNKNNASMANVFYTSSVGDLDDYVNAARIYKRGSTWVEKLGLRVQAEGYDEMVGMQVEGCEDGGQELGFVDNGDYATYTVNIPTAGTYSLRVRGASPNTGATVQLRSASGTTLGSAVIGNTGGWQVWDCFTSGTFSLPAGEQTLTLYIAQGGCNLNWFELVGAAGSASVTTVGTGTTRVQAENFVEMSGIQTENSSDLDGTQNVGYTNGGDWMDYKLNVQSAGTYKLVLRAASPYTTGVVDVKQLGLTKARLAVATTGAWQTYGNNESTNFTLLAGEQTLRLYFEGGDCNLNWFELVRVGAAAGIGSNYAGESVTGPDTDLIGGGSTGGGSTEVVTDPVAGDGTVYYASAVGNDASIDDEGYCFNMHNAGAYADFTGVNGGTGGTATVTLYYAMVGSDPATVGVSINGTAATTLSLTSTSGWSDYSGTATATVTLTAGTVNTIRLTGGAGGFNLAFITVVPTTTGGSSGGSTTIPVIGSSAVRIEAENYTAMYGIETENCGDTDGGQDVGYTHNGDWLDYTINVQQAGTYALSLRLASPYNTGCLYVQQGGVALTQCDLTTTGGWQTYQTFAAGTLVLAAGEQTLRLYVQSGDLNINWLQLTLDANASVKAGNPVISTMFTADPSAHVWSQNGKIYMYASHDVFPSQGCDLMDAYHIFSSENMVDWNDEGEILASDDLDWGISGFMWAPDCAYKNGTYYFYYPHPSASPWNDNWKIGVATSNSPVANFTDQGYMSDLAGYSLIDPCVFEDDDGSYYIYIGGGATCMGGKLADDMMSIDGSMTAMTGLGDFHEGAWVFKRGGTYYLTYADNTNGENEMRYATASTPLGPWTERGTFLEGTGCDTTHGSVVQYKGNWYLFYHNSAISDNGTLRSVCIDRLYFNTDGTIRMVEQTGEGVSAIAPVTGDNTSVSNESLSQYTQTSTYNLNSCTVGGGATKGNTVENLHISGSYAQFSGINGGNGGKALVRVYYATPDGASAKIDATGDTAGDGYFMALPATSGWSDVSGVGTCLVDLVAGTGNTIRVTGGMGGFNLAYITVSLVPGSAPTTTTTTTTTTATTTTTTQAAGSTQATYYASAVGNNASLTGEGYVQNLHNANAYCDFTVQGTGSEATIELTYALESGTATAGVAVNGTAADNLSLTATGGWSTYTGHATFTANLQSGSNTIRFIGGAGGFNLAYITVTTAAARTPIHVEAENYTAMTGIQTEGCGDVGGTDDVGFTDNGDWLDYSVNVAAAGTYKLALRASSPNGGGLVELRRGSTTLGQVAVGQTNGWQTYQTFQSGTFQLAAGTQTLRLYIQNAGVNLNWFELIPA